ncbi:autoinducer binding domain-containing protein [Paracoccus kondratievae]
MEILQDVEEMLEARSAQVVWEYYVARLTDLGFPNVLYYGTRILDSTSRRMIDDSVLLSSYDGSLLEELVDLGLFDSMPMYLWLVENPGCDSWDWIHRRRLEGLLSPREERAGSFCAAWPCRRLWPWSGRWGQAPSRGRSSQRKAGDVAA